MEPAVIRHSQPRPSVRLGLARRGEANPSRALTCPPGLPWIRRSCDRAIGDLLGAQGDNLGQPVRRSLHRDL
jgi:hypothetical protein